MLTFTTHRSDAVHGQNAQSFQAENGTLFHYYANYDTTGRTPPTHRLYAKLENKEVDAKLPDVGYKSLTSISVHVNCLYFQINKKIYKAEVTASGVIDVNEQRGILEGETIRPGGICHRVCDKKLRVYRLCDDPEKDAILLDASLDISKLHGIYRGRAVFVKDANTPNVTGNPTVTKSEENLLELAIPNYNAQSMICSHDSSPFIYFLAYSNFFALDTEIMEFMPTINTQLSYAFDAFNGVFDGTISVLYCNNSQARYNQYTFHTMHAKLPDGYYESKLRINVRTMAERLNKMEAVQNGWSQQMESSIQQKMEMEKKLKAAQQLWTKEKDVLSKKAMDAESKNELLATENEKMKLQIKEMAKLLINSKVWALQTVKSTLKFEESEKLAKPLVCIQLENGTMVYFDNAKPFELFTMKDDSKDIADRTLLEGEFDCTFHGVIGDSAYFSTNRGKFIKFFKAFVDDGKLTLQVINEMRTSEISLFKNQPLYFIERSQEWAVFQYHEKYAEMEGEKFDISKIDLLSKYDRHYHRGILYLFRETMTAKVEKVNDKVVIVEGPLLDETSYYTPPHSDYIYILNSEQNVLLFLNTVDLSVSQQCYEPPADSNHHSIVGIHDGILTMAFDGVWGRHLSTAKMN